MLGWPEVVAILAVALVLFGARKLPELARGLGQGIREFKKATREIQDEIERAAEETPPPLKTSNGGAASATAPPEHPVAR